MSLYLTLHNSIMALAWRYFTLLDCTQLYHGTTSLYLTLNNSTMSLLHSTRLYITVPWL